MAALRGEQVELAAPARRPAPCVAFEGVGVSYAAGRRRIDAVRDITLAVEEGEFVALVVPTGCGKSTLLRVVADLVPPSTGRVRVREQPAAAARRVNEFGFVF